MSLNDVPTDFRERMKVYNVNRPLISADELRRFADQWVALRWDGSGVVAGDPDFERLIQKIIAAGLDEHHDVMYEWLPAEHDLAVGGTELTDTIETTRATSA